MKSKMSLWIFGIGGVISNVVCAVFFYPLLYMFTQFYLFTWIMFLILAALFFPVLIILFIAVLKLKRWGRNIFITITLTMNCLTILFLTMMQLTSGMTVFLIVDTILTVFIISFMVYFLKPSSRELFNK